MKPKINSLVPERVARIPKRVARRLLLLSPIQRRVQAELAETRSDVSRMILEHQVFITRHLLQIQERIDSLGASTAHPAAESDRLIELRRTLNSPDNGSALSEPSINQPRQFVVNVDGTLSPINDEQIVAIPLAIRALANLPLGSRILTVGCGESLLPLYLASIGYHVATLDSDPCPIRHPRINLLDSTAFSVNEALVFDAAILLSISDPAGFSESGPKSLTGLNHEFLNSLKRLLHGSGILVFYSRFGRSGSHQMRPTYTKKDLDQLLVGYRVAEEPIVIIQRRLTEWTYDPSGYVDPDDDLERVVMITAAPR